MGKSVAILGGGVAGLSAAHELGQRGFDVSVYERSTVPGGKARSVQIPDTGTDGRRDLPGEHGFRFFPRFYKHLPDTMSRIPYRGGWVSDNLVQTSRLEYPRVGQAPVVVLDRFPQSWSDLIQLTHEILNPPDMGIPREEGMYFAERFWQIATSCQDRRLDEYEKLGWWDYTGAASRSAAYQKYLAIGLTRSLNACKAEYASTKTIGDILFQLAMDFVAPGLSSDRLLNGPTNDVWIDPWIAFLQSEYGVKYHLNSSLFALDVDVANRRINHAVVGAPSGTGRFQVEADYYLLAVPLEVAAQIVGASPGSDQPSDLVKADPTLAGILAIRQNVQWMNGIQFYLNVPLSIVPGHLLYVDTPWALTSISQAQFWGDFPMTGFGDGTVKGILSVDISEWEQPGLNGKMAKDCSKDEIAEETWAQLKQSLNYGSTVVLSDDMRHQGYPWYYLDRDIERLELLPGDPASKTDVNAEPLLVNYVNSWTSRPDAYTRISNFFLAADYVRTFTDLASMEGANEAARRATNAICDAAGVKTELCELWRLHEPDFLFPLREYDQRRYDQGLPWGALPHIPSHFEGLVGKLFHHATKS